MANSKMDKVLPDAGLGRWWRITLDKRSNLKPIRVSLMQNNDAAKGRKSFATELSYERTTADRVKVAIAAEAVLQRVGAYESVIGDYHTEETR